MSALFQSEFAFQVKGDSMSPLIRPGDEVRVNGDLIPRHGNIVLVHLDGRVMIRQLFRSGSLTSLLPGNSDYEAIAIDAGSPCEIQGVVTHVTHALDL